MSDIYSRVKAIIVDNLGVDENEVVTEANFTNDLGADSLDTVELIMEFEKEFDIQIPDDQADEKKMLLEGLGAKVKVVPCCAISNECKIIQSLVISLSLLKTLIPLPPPP